MHVLREEPGKKRHWMLSQDCHCLRHPFFYSPDTWNNCGHCYPEFYLIDDEGKVYLTLRGYRTMQLPGSIKDDLLRPLKEKMAGV